MRYRVILIASLYLLSVSAHSQQGDTIRNYQYAIDLFKINTHINSLSNTAVSFQYLYSLSDNPGTIVDSLTAYYHLEKGMMRGEMEDNQILRNSKYSLTINSEDSMIVVSKLGAGASTFQINFFDSLFRISNVEGVDKLKLQNGENVLTITFKPQSYYKGYNVTYSDNYQIRKVHLEFLDTDYDDNGNPPPPGRRKILEVSFNNFHEEVYDMSNFNEGLFVTKNEYGKWTGVGQYNNFQVMATQPDL